MGSLHNDLMSWAATARKNGQPTIYLDLETAEKIAQQLMDDTEKIDLMADHLLTTNASLAKFSKDLDDIKESLLGAASAKAKITTDTQAKLNRDFYEK